MARAGKVLIWIAAAFWSLLAWIGYAVLETVGGWVARNADAATTNPETVEFLFKAATFLTSLGLYGIIFVWFVGIVLIFALLPVIRLLAGRRTPLRQLQRPSR